MSKEQHFFNNIAEKWDDMRGVDPAKIENLVAKIGLRSGDCVLDTGCGTGVLVPFVKQVIGDTGSVTAVDFAEKMIALAAEKHKDLAGVSFVASDIMKFASEQPFDKIICFNFYPHISDKPQFLHNMRNMLTGDGCLVIMHDISRDKVNAVHGTSETVKNDRLPVAAETVAVLEEAGYRVTDIIDSDEMYFIRACIR